MERLMTALSDLPPEDRAREALNLSSKLIEFAAFEAATWLPSGHVAELIGWSVKLDERAHGLPVANRPPVVLALASRVN